MKTVALVLQPVVPTYRSGIREGVLQAAEKFGGVQVIEMPFQTSGARPMKRGMESLDGIVTWADGRQKWIKEVSEAGVPIVNCGGDWEPSEKLGAVAVQMVSLLELAVSHCRDLSIPRLKFFGQLVSSSEGRIKFVEALAGRAAPFGIETGFIEVGGVPPNQSLSRLLNPQSEKKLLKCFQKHDLPLALFCEDDHFARLACNLAKLAGIRMPEDLAVLGASDDVVGRLGEPPISTIRLPGREIGEQAFQLISRNWAGEAMPAERIQIPATELIPRESTVGKSLEVALERTRRKIELGALKGVTFEELATSSGMSQKVLRRRYAEAFGETPTEQLRRLRIEAANRLLEGDSSMTEIATACGFASPGAFYNFYNRHTGMAPSDFRLQASGKG
ncbi:MAG: helix-turn-helix domain-containing protein [Akkermansiaceae bacterium]